MSSMDLVLSEKYKAFLKCQTPVEFLEGTTAAGKTTVGIFKFMLKVAQSPKKASYPGSRRHRNSREKHYQQRPWNPGRFRKPGRVQRIWHQG